MPDLYFIACGKRPFFPERDPDSMSRSVTIRDIIAGQFDHLRKVYRWDTDAGTMTDVSEDIAREILAGLADEPTGDLLDYIEDHLGCGAVSEYAHERWEAA